MAISARGLQRLADKLVLTDAPSIPRWGVFWDAQDVLLGRTSNASR